MVARRAADDAGSPLRICKVRYLVVRASNLEGEHRLQAEVSIAATILVHQMRQPHLQILTLQENPVVQQDTLRSCLIQGRFDRHIVYAGGENPLREARKP